MVCSCAIKYYFDNFFTANTEEVDGENTNDLLTLHKNTVTYHAPTDFHMTFKRMENKMGCYKYS